MFKKYRVHFNYWCVLNMFIILWVFFICGITNAQYYSPSNDSPAISTGNNAGITLYSKAVIVMPIKISSDKSNSGEIKLHWTASGDDNDSGQAYGYDLRYQTVLGGPINSDSRWQAAISIVNEPAPSLAGSIDSVLASGFVIGQSYYFAIKAYDNAGNYSALSNSPLRIASDLGYFLTIQTQGYGEIFCEPEKEIYSYGDEIILYAEPDDYWNFDGWSGDIISQINPIYFYITDDLIVTAIFTTDFIPGDANGDGNVVGSDVTYLVRYFANLVPAPDPYYAGDCNGDCRILGNDVTYLIGYFRGTGSQPVRGDCTGDLISILDKKR